MGRSVGPYFYLLGFSGGRLYLRTHLALCEALLTRFSRRIADPGVEPALEIERLVRAYSASLERFVMRYPEQYYWVHRRWKTRPPGDRGGEGNGAEGDTGSAEAETRGTASRSGRG